MTTTTDVTPTDVEPELCWLNLADMTPHPDNPRQSLGDLTELTRSIRSHGILEPLVVLPANDEGVYLIVAGRRRHAAGIKAEVTDVPAVVRPMTSAEVIEAGLSENGHRADLTLSEEVRAIERLMSLDEGVTPARLCKRIGRSQAWVRARMAVTILPSRWRAALDQGDLSLAAGEAAASVADLGPENLDAVCEQLVGRGWQEPSRVVADYRDELRRASEYEAAVAKATAGPHPVFTAEDPPPEKAKALGEMFDPDSIKAHTSEPCHAVVVQRPAWHSATVQVQAICTDPRRHSPKRVAVGTGSDLARDQPTRRGGDDSHAKRQGRLSRLAHGTEVFARSRGGVNQRDLTAAVQHALVREASGDALRFAATILGYAEPRDVTASDLLTDADTPASLARIAGAVAYGMAETHMYWSPAECSDYLNMLTTTGWAPDDWTSQVVLTDRHPETSGTNSGSDGSDEPA